MTHFLFDLFRRLKNKFKKYDRFARVYLTIDKLQLWNRLRLLWLRSPVFFFIFPRYGLLWVLNAMRKNELECPCAILYPPPTFSHLLPPPFNDCNSYRIFKTVLNSFLMKFFVFILFVIYFICYLFSYPLLDSHRWNSSVKRDTTLLKLLPNRSKNNYS